MKAIEISQPGGPEVLRPCERPMPVAGAGEVLIRVHAAGVNRPDVLQRAGAYPPPPDASDLPGLEVAGEIVSGDLDGSDFKKGDLVCALAHGGGYAEYCVVPIGQCLPIPKGWSLLEAASLPETFFTVYGNVFDRAKLAAGESLLVQGGSSGIGVTAIQMATALGHRVFVTAGTDDKCRACESLGAERGINYRSEDFVEIVRSLTGGKGANVILDMVAGPYVNRELIIALLGGASGEINFGEVLRRRLVITGSTLRPRPVTFKRHIAQQLRTHVWPLLESGRIKPVIYKTFSLEQAADAHALMESSTHVGKIMLQVRR